MMNTRERELGLQLLQLLEENDNLKRWVISTSKTIQDVIGCGKVELLYGIKAPEGMTQPDRNDDSNKNL